MEKSSTVVRRRENTPRQAALAFLTREPNVFAIPKAARAGHVQENAGAGDVELAAEAIHKLDAAFPRGRPGRGLPML